MVVFKYNYRKFITEKLPIKFMKKIGLFSGFFLSLLFMSN